ncbi:Terminase small subunit [Rhizobium sp. AN5]|uniref:terminase small subunit n=1 Tax=Rhizobium sp. AN5 TaxID=1855304 RepID=UPI000BC4C3A0|nr:terminase small subunit [Rhizobium sp. AN5]SOC92467.1 Terminase small subunit [Rhizobium sp. AN5]
MSDLTKKQRRFVDEYLIDLNGSQAAIRAGYSRRNANDQAAQLLAKPAIRDAIASAMQSRSERTQVDADWVLQRLAREADADLADLYDDDNNLLSVEEWPLIWRQGLVTGVDIEVLFEGQGEDRKEVGRVKKIRMSDRIRRLELIGKHVRVNAFQETINVKVFDGLADRLERARKRLDRIEDATFVALDATPAPEPLPSRNSTASLLPGNLDVDGPPAPKPKPQKPPPPVYRPILPRPAEKPVSAGADYQSPDRTFFKIERKTE